MLDSLVYKEERVGYIVNKETPNNSKFKKWIGLSDRHWVAVKSVSMGIFVELDSKAESK